MNLSNILNQTLLDRCSMYIPDYIESEHMRLSAQNTLLFLIIVSMMLLLHSWKEPGISIFRIIALIGLFVAVIDIVYLYL